MANKTPDDSDVDSDSELGDPVSGSDSADSDSRQVASLGPCIIYPCLYIVVMFVL